MRATMLYPRKKIQQEPKSSGEHGNPTHISSHQCPPPPGDSSRSENIIRPRPNMILSNAGSSTKGRGRSMPRVNTAVYMHDVCLHTVPARSLAEPLAAAARLASPRRSCRHAGLRLGPPGRSSAPTACCLSPHRRSARAPASSCRCRRFRHPFCRGWWRWWVSPRRPRRRCVLLLRHLIVLGSGVWGRGGVND